ncbi:hypothetical protein PNP85_06295 [Halobacterium salinarum]|uniref:hypothetical protein n=1 Tax=Halobacterium salinarum TaxID=2242 RepID=UPI002554FDA4|nr:hypothetical protein [Halobacterium salinarum]MDL0139111.1 hypothetical protein [Halobacterium salinarum]
MAAFIEPLLQEQLWYWLETEKGMTVDGEVSLKTGRIDLAAETPEGKYIGIEMKRGSGLEFGSRLYEQVHRYIESGAFDEIYFASRSIDPIISELEGGQNPSVTTLSQASKKINSAIQRGDTTLEQAKSRIKAEVPDDLLNHHKSGRWESVQAYIFDKIESETDGSSSLVSIDEGIRHLCRARCPVELGVIHVPLNLQDGVLRDLDRVHEPEKAYEPIIHREAGQLDRHTKPEFNRREEPWIRHHVWRDYGGLPEGYVPNDLSSDQSYRPIDVLTFSKSYDPTEIFDASEGDVIGIEAKGEQSFDKMRLSDQISEFLATKSLSKLLLAVPASLERQAVELLDVHKQGGKIGLLSVSEDGDLTLVRDAPQLGLEHDGYLKRNSPQKTGYGDVEIEGGKDVSSPYITAEEKERRKYPNASERALELLTDHSEKTNENGWIENEPPSNLNPPAHKFDIEDTARAYLLRGVSADPYPGDPSKPKEGYIRLRITDYEIDDKFAVKLRFGRGSSEGGYISLVEEQIQALIDVLASLETIHGGSIPGQGMYIDLETYLSDKGGNEPHRVSSSSGEIQSLLLDVISADDSTDTVAYLQLGENRSQGVEVELTEAQRLDLLATLAILREGNHRQLPGQYTSSPRIGPSGENTWSIGTRIEEENNPPPPEEW